MWLSLPSDLWRLVFLKLSFFERKRLALVCRRFHQLILNLGRTRIILSKEVQLSQMPSNLRSCPLEELTLNLNKFDPSRFGGDILSGRFGKLSTWTQVKNLKLIPEGRSELVLPFKDLLKNNNDDLPGDPIIARIFTESHNFRLESLKLYQMITPQLVPRTSLRNLSLQLPQSAALPGLTSLPNLTQLEIINITFNFDFERCLQNIDWSKLIQLRSLSILWKHNTPYSWMRQFKLVFLTQLTRLRKLKIRGFHLDPIPGLKVDEISTEVELHLAQNAPLAVVTVTQPLLMEYVETRFIRKLEVAINTDSYQVSEWFPEADFPSLEKLILRTANHIVQRTIPKLSKLRVLDLTINHGLDLPSNRIPISKLCQLIGLEKLTLIGMMTKTYQADLPVENLFKLPLLMEVHFGLTFLDPPKIPSGIRIIQ